MNPRYSKQAKKFLDKQNADVEMRIKSAINKLPLGDVKKMIDYTNTYRLRVGSYRVFFAREDNTISVRKIDNRGQIYKD